MHGIVQKLESILSKASMKRSHIEKQFRSFDHMPVYRVLHRLQAKFDGVAGFVLPPGTFAQEIRAAACIVFRNRSWRLIAHAN